LRHFAKPRPDELDLAIFAVSQVRRWGGVLEHPASSSLWVAAGLPRPGCFDSHRGWTYACSQFWWGHRARKDTWLYIVGVSPGELPCVPFTLGDATHVIAQSPRSDGSRRRKGDADYRPEVSRAEREHTPPLFASWLVEVARLSVPEPRP
jgi:hypothetical protein